MASKSPQPLLRMRDMFIGASKQQTHWFPGHMAKGLRVMEQHIARCDGFIEVHDARIPGIGRNPKFDVLADKPRILVMNKVHRLAYSYFSFATASNLKADLAYKRIPKNTKDIIYTNCKLDRCPNLPQASSICYSFSIAKFSFCLFPCAINIDNSQGHGKD
eukprot:m.146354 g.146354  ORF g.146354 m.146354 type:complete len:161 (-) comp14969_c0_seq1:25-507(-)